MVGLSKRRQQYLGLGLGFPGAYPKIVVLGLRARARSYQTVKCHLPGKEVILLQSSRSNIFLKGHHKLK